MHCLCSINFIYFDQFSFPPFTFTFGSLLVVIERIVFQSTLLNTKQGIKKYERPLLQNISWKVFLKVNGESMTAYTFKGKFTLESWIYKGSLGKIYQENY